VSKAVVLFVHPALHHIYTVPMCPVAKNLDKTKCCIQTVQIG